MMTKRDLKWDACRVSQLYSRLDADHLVSLDVPPNGLDSQIDRSYKYDETISNLEQLADRFGNRVVPVIHGTNLDEVEKNCLRTARVCPSPGLVGIGGLVPTLQKSGSIRNAENNIPHKWISDVVRCVRSHFPCSPLHLFGVGSLHTVLAVFALGVQSVDSIGWRQAAGFGSVYIPGRHRRLLTNRRRVRLCRPFASCEDLEILAACICPECRGSEQRGSNIERLGSTLSPGRFTISGSFMVKLRHISQLGKYVRTRRFSHLGSLMHGKARLVSDCLGLRGVIGWMN